MSNRKEAIGSRPPPQNRPSTSSLSIVFIMGLVIIGAFVASGSLVPVDPNGPGGPPTLAPYYNPADYPVQNIITPTGGFPTGKQNLQLETFGVDNCGTNSVMLFVIDTSGSMSYDDKIGHEKQALTYFTSNMGGLSAIGIDTFGGNPGDVTTQIPLSYYKDVKTQVPQVINGLTANGGTPTRDAMELAYNQLNQSISEEQYPNYQYNLILITDGVPEQLPPRTCEEQTYDPRDAPLPRCFAEQEDPTIPTDISAEIRTLGVDVYAINVYSPSWPSDAYMFPYLSVMLEKVASEPSSTHYFVSVDGNNLSDVLQSINQSICEDELNGPAPSQ
jgi:hypothetical protein